MQAQSTAQIGTSTRAAMLLVQAGNGGAGKSSVTNSAARAASSAQRRGGCRVRGQVKHRLNTTPGQLAMGVSRAFENKGMMPVGVKSMPAREPLVDQ